MHGAHFFSQSQIKDERNGLGDDEQKYLKICTSQTLFPPIQART